MCYTLCSSIDNGCNDFELRMYDARFGRWLSVDPYGQFASPYVGMGNIPNIWTDPDGGWSLVGSVIGAAADVGLSFSLGDEDNWGWYALGGFVAGGILGEAAQAQTELIKSGQIVGIGSRQNLGRGKPLVRVA